MVDDSEFETREGVIVGLIALGAIVFLILTFFLASFGENISSPFGDWSFKEWTTVGIWVLIAGSILLAIYWGSDDEGTDDVFEGGYGFPVTIGVLLLGLLLVNTSFFGLAIPQDDLIDLDGDGTGDIKYSELPDGYVDYGEPQPYGFGNYGPEDEGLLTGLQGAGAGCIVGGVIGGIIGGAFTWGFGAPATAAIGCGLGGGGGFALSEADFDGDPTTGW
jgi:hypothetical protein